MPGTRVNEDLSRLLAQADWTPVQLAAAVRAIAAESGRLLLCDRTTVHRWLRGVRPRGHTPEYIAEAFARRLGRPVTVAEIGLVRMPGGALPPDDPMWHPGARDALSVLIARVRAHTPRYPGGAHEVLSVDALRVPHWEQLSADETGTLPTCPLPGTRVGPVEIGTVRTMVDAFSTALELHGGVPAHGALVGFLATAPLIWLRRGGTAGAHRELLSLTARLTLVLSVQFTDFEAERTAQQCRLTAARLAAAAGDRGGYAAAVQMMSAAAADQRLGPECLRLARAARLAESVPSARSYGHLALACALAGLHEEARQGLARAREHATQQDRAELARLRGETWCALGDVDRALPAFAESVRLRGPHERRSLLFLHARIAEIHLAQGHLNAACASWERFLDAYEQVWSVRADRRFMELRRRLRVYQRHPAAAALLDRASVTRSVA